MDFKGLTELSHNCFKTGYTLVTTLEYPTDCCSGNSTHF